MAARAQSELERWATEMSLSWHAPAQESSITDAETAETTKTIEPAEA